MGVVGSEPENIIQSLPDDFLLARVLNLLTHFQYKLYLDQVVYFQACIFSLQVKMNSMRNIRPSLWQINFEEKHV